jgi:hypothetical protein
MAMHYRPLDSKRNEIRLLKIHEADCCDLGQVTGGLVIEEAKIELI